MRFTLASTLVLGLAVVGCGPSPDSAPVTPAGGGTPATTQGEATTSGAPTGGAMNGPAPGAVPPDAAPSGGGGGPTPETKKAMESDSYRKASQSADNKNQKAEGFEPKQAGDAPKDAPAAEPKKDAPAAEPKKDEPAAEPKKDDAPKVAAVTLSPEEISAIKALPAADQEAALAQKVCPSNTDDDGKPAHLGSMGTPVKVDLKGKAVFVCCKGCVDDVKANPDKTLTKLGK